MDSESNTGAAHRNRPDRRISLGTKRFAGWRVHGAGLVEEACTPPALVLGADQGKAVVFREVREVLGVEGCQRQVVS